MSEIFEDDSVDADYRRIARSPTTFKRVFGRSPNKPVPPPRTSPSKTCAATTKAGTRCTRATKGQTFCKQHATQISDSI